MAMRARTIVHDLLKRFRRGNGVVAQSSISVRSIIWAYRLFLDRDPENAQVVKEKLARLRTVHELRREFMNSDEFKQKNLWLKTLSLSGNEPPMSIQDVHSAIALQELFTHIQDSWKYLGETEPHWSVITSERYLSQNIKSNEDSFYESGKYDVDKLFNSLKRNKIDFTGFKSCLEYGCGLGRVTTWLANRFEIVYAYDISMAHLRGAEEYLNLHGVNNVILHPLKKVRDIENLPKVDLVYSIIVLQHNPPPLIKFIIREFLKALTSGGVAFFQVPTYQHGYCFSLEEYLTETRKNQMEMHVVPQSQIFDLVRQENGRVVEVIEDNMAGLGYGALSNTFLIQKNEDM